MPPSRVGGVDEPCALAADKGYHSRKQLKALEGGVWKTRIAEPEPASGYLRWHGDEAARKAVYAQPGAVEIRDRAGDHAAARRDGRAILRPHPRSRRHATSVAARTRKPARSDGLPVQS